IILSIAAGKSEKLNLREKGELSELDWSDCRHTLGSCEGRCISSMLLSLWRGKAIQSNWKLSSHLMTNSFSTTNRGAHRGAQRSLVKNRFSAAIISITKESNEKRRSQSHHHCGLFVIKTTTAPVVLSPTLPHSPPLSGH